MNAPVSNLRTLVLNADLQPLSWAPLSVWSWQQALVAVLQERVVQLKAYEDVLVHSASRPYDVPAVVALKRYRKRKKVSFTRYHVFLRDEFTCQYCGNQFAAKDLTFDHVVPRSRSGQSSWDKLCVVNSILFLVFQLVESNMRSLSLLSNFFSASRVLDRVTMTVGGSQ